MSSRTTRQITHQIHVLNTQKCSCLSQCVIACIVVVLKSDPSSAVNFPNFLGDIWQTNGCVPLRINCSILFQWHNCFMSSFTKKTGDHLLGSAPCADNFFSWIWLILKQPYSQLLFPFGLKRVNSRFITYHAVIDMFRRTAIAFLEQLLRRIKRF